MSNVKFSGDWNKKYTKKSSTGAALVIIYHHLLKDIGNIMHKNLYMLYMDQESLKVFKSRPMINFRGARKLSSYLVRAKLHPFKLTLGPCKHNGKRCEFCENFTETSTFSSSLSLKVHRK